MARMWLRWRIAGRAEREEAAVLLGGRNAVIYGASGSVGGAVARAFAREGARVFLTGRTAARLDALADEITAAGGYAETAEVDALDESSVDRHVDRLVDQVGCVDISFNAIGHGDMHGTPLLDLPYEDFMRPVVNAVRTQFLTARAAARHMVGRGRGVIMAITATTARKAIPEVGGTGVAFDAIESLCRQWACELGPHGVRVVWLLTTGLPEALADVDEQPGYGRGLGRGMTREELVEWMRDQTMLKRLTSLRDVGNAAALLASDLAGATTGSGFNITCGSIPG
jgi:NAD(P)-dependent dehydrogenase (short-subunit alcohol dehydrogenase family)